MVDVILHVGDAAAFEACPDPWANETRGAWTTAERSKRSELATLVRDIFGNPFRPLAFDPAWRTTDVTLLARGIYEEKAFDRLPILADALQDAGCEVADILDHLRDPKQTHVRGCSALDLVLGKA
jgi:hypothetical protein